MLRQSREQMMSTIHTTRVTCCLLLAIAVLGVATTHSEPLASGVCDARAQDAVLDFALQDVNGNVVNLAAFKGRVIVLNFWATWCGPCKTEIPMLVKLHDKHGTSGLTVIGLSIDTDLEKVRHFVQQYKMDYPTFMIGRDHAIDKAYGPRWAVPATVVIRLDGVICRREIGGISERRFENRLLELLRLTSSSR